VRRKAMNIIPHENSEKILIMIVGIMIHKKFFLFSDHIASVKIIAKEDIGDAPKTIKRERKDTSKMEVKSNIKNITVSSISVKTINHLR